MPTGATTTPPVGRARRLAGWLLLAAVASSARVAAASPGPAFGAPPPPRLYVIGVLAHRPKPQVLAGWQPLAESLSRALPGSRFVVEALDYPELEAAIAARRIDIAITNPGHYVGIRTRVPGAGLLATVVEQGPGVALPVFGGVIFARADRADLTDLASLKGARIAAVGTSSLGGYQAQVFELLQAGVALPGPDRLLLTGMPHDRAIQAVLSGEADAGFARAGTLEQLAAEGRLDASRLKVLNRQPASDFPYAVSTRLYPGWPVVALAGVGEVASRHIAAALLTLPHVDGGPDAAYHGFTVPADHGDVEAVLRQLRLPPFDGLPSFDARDVLRRYQAPIASLGAAGLVIALLAGFLVAVNRRLARARRVAEDTLAELRVALSKVKQLSGMLPICMYCHKIRTDLGYWDRLEVFISEHSDAAFSHGICPTCLEKNHPPEA